MDEHLVANRANWDDRTRIHLASRFYDVEGWLRDGRGPPSWERAALGDLAGLRLLQLQCHFGLDALAWARTGAYVTGLDFSPVAIDAARYIAERAGLGERATFVCADVDDAAAALGHAVFDVVYVSLGALCWLPSAARWAEQVAQLVAPGGRFYLHDVHPLSWALAEDALVVEESYFEEDEPYVADSASTYTDGGRPVEHGRHYEWNHGIGETVTALVRRGLRLEWLGEHDWTLSPRFTWLVRGEERTWRLPPGVPRVPLSYSLLASRPA